MDCSMACWNGSSHGRLQNWRAWIGTYSNREKGNDTHIGGFVHVDPCPIYVDPSFRAVERFKFGGPVPIIQGWFSTLRVCENWKTYC